MVPDVPHIRIVGPPQDKVAGPDEEEKPQDKPGSSHLSSRKVMFAVPSKSSRHSGRRHGRVPFVPPSESGSKLTNPSQTTRSLERRRKVALAPGHSAVDWEKSKSQEDLRRIDPSDFPMRITKAQLKQHHTKNDCWMAFNHKVYNITNYLDYHPGGREILIENSGTDAIQLFQRYHPWVNYERILDACFIGFLV